MKSKLTKLILVLLIISAAGTSVAAQDWDGYRVEYDYNESSTGDIVNNVESVAFNCNDSSCSSVSSFGGEYPNGQSTTNGEMTIDFPADLQDQGYAVYHFADGYVPLEYNADVSCQESAGSSCGPLEVDRSFSKIDKCSATIDSFTVQNDVYRNEPVTVGVNTSMDSEVQSAFSENDNGVEHVPPSYKDQFYKAWTDVNLTVTDSDGDVVKTESVAENIYMSSTADVQFTWTPSQEGNHTIQLETNVTDAQCADSVTSSTSKDITVQPERPQEEYYTLINDLNVQSSNPTAGKEQTLSFSKISNYAKEDYSKVAVQTDVNYSIQDDGGNEVFSDSETLAANSNVEDAEFHSFTWTPQQKGSYTVSVTGESVESQGTYPTSPETQSITFYVEEQPTYDVRFSVNDENGQDLEGATAEINSKSNQTSSNGVAYITDLNTGSYTYKVSKSGYVSSEGTVDISSDSPETTEIGLSLKTENTAPTISGVPNQVNFTEGDSKTLNLDDYVQDDESLDSDLSWSYSGNNNVGVNIDSDRVINFTSDSWTGTEEVSITVTDPEGLTDSTSLTVNVTEQNQAPTVENLPDKQLDEDTTLRDEFYLGDYISDPETSFDNLDVSIADTSSDKCGVSIESDGFVDIVPEQDFAGSCTVTIQAKDPEGLTSQDSFQVTVNPVNDAPTITSSAPTQVDAYSTYRYDMNAEDPDDSSLSYNVESGPSNLTVNGSVFEWDRPDNDDAGTYSVNLSVSDGELSDSESFTLTVNESNVTQAPIADIQVNTTEGSIPLTVSFNGSGSYDPDGSITSYDWSFGEGGKDTGETANYTYTDGGVYTATLTVEDNASATSTASVTINVSNNDRPFFTTSPPTSTTVNQEYSYDTDASDNDGDTLEYFLSQKPQGMTINNNTGVIKWTPSNTGSYPVTVVASDNQLNGTQSYTLQVNQQSNNGGGGNNDGDSGSSGGSSGGGGGGFGGGFLPDEETEAENIEDRIQTGENEVDLDIEPGIDDSYNLTFNVSEDTNITTSVTGNVSEIVSLPANFTAKKGENELPLQINGSVPGNYTGNLTLQWNNQTLTIPLNLNIEDTGASDYSVAILHKSTANQRISYDVKLWDEEKSDTSNQVSITTSVVDSEGDEVYRNTETERIYDVLVQNYRTSILPEGEYTVTATVHDNREEFTGSRTIQLGPSETITGQFTSSNSLGSLFQDIMVSISNMF